LSIETYADFLNCRRETTVESKGVRWMNYRGALIPAAAMPVYIDFSPEEAAQLVKEAGALFLRYTTGPTDIPTDWWHIICRQYDFNKVSTNTRSKIRRGMKRLQIRRINPEWLAENGYDCYWRCYQRYKHAGIESRKKYTAFIRSLDGVNIFHIWGCFKEEELLGYIICLHERDGVFLHTVDITPAGLHDYAAYVMIHQLLEYYVNEEHIAVSNGSRSISHETDMQDFLLKLGFQREYCLLHVVYRPGVAFVVRLLYPFRSILKRLQAIPLIHNISAVLYQESILRQQEHIT